MIEAVVETFLGATQRRPGEVADKDDAVSMFQAGVQQADGQLLSLLGLRLTLAGGADGGRLDVVATQPRRGGALAHDHVVDVVDRRLRRWCLEQPAAQSLTHRGRDDELTVPTHHFSGRGDTNVGPVAGCRERRANRHETVVRLVVE